MSVSFDSATYPYQRISAGNNTLAGSEKIPYQVLCYLLDLPDSLGYMPRDDNSRPRVRLAKYLWYDNADPLSGALPTPKQKLSMLYDPTHPTVNTDEEKAAHPVGYRMYWQHTTKQSILEEKTFIKCYLGRIFSPRPYFTTIGVRAEIWTGAGLETSMATDVESRCFAIEQAITESLANVNMVGVGTFSFLRQDHADNGSVPIYASDGTILGRSLHCSVTWSDGQTGSVSGECDNC